LKEGGHPRDYVALDMQDETRRTVLSIFFAKNHRERQAFDIFAVQP